MLPSTRRPVKSRALARMSLNLSKLNAHRSWLQTLLPDPSGMIDSEISAVRTLIRFERLRQRWLQRPLDGLSVLKAVKLLFEGNNMDGSTADEITKILQQNRTTRNPKSLRANVGLALKNLTEIEYLDRSDIWGSKYEHYAYFLTPTSSEGEEIDEEAREDEFNEYDIYEL